MINDDNIESVLVIFTTEEFNKLNLPDFKEYYMTNEYPSTIGKRLEVLLKEQKRLLDENEEIKDFIEMRRMEKEIKRLREKLGV